MRYLAYLIIRWVPLALAFPIMGLLAIFAPAIILAAFDLNATWTPWVASAFKTLGEQFIAPHLLPGAWASIQGLVDGISALYNAFVMGIHTLAAQLPEEYGARTEVFVRGYLVEGWLVIAEIAAVLRWFVSRLFR